MFIINLFVPTFVDFYDIGTVIEKSHIHLFNFFIIKRNQAEGEKVLKFSKLFCLFPSNFVVKKSTRSIYVHICICTYTREVVVRKDKLTQ